MVRGSPPDSDKVKTGPQRDNALEESNRYCSTKAVPAISDSCTTAVESNESGNSTVRRSSSAKLIPAASTSAPPSSPQGSPPATSSTASDGGGAVPTTGDRWLFTTASQQLRSIERETVAADDATDDLGPPSPTGVDTVADVSSMLPIAGDGAAPNLLPEMDQTKTAAPPPLDVLDDDSVAAELQTKAFESLEDQLNRTRWVVPVLPKQELEQLMKSAIKMIKLGTDKGDARLDYFLRCSLFTSFQRLMKDDAVKDWKAGIQNHIRIAVNRLIDLICLKLKSDPESPVTMMPLLSLIFDASNKYHTHNAREPSKLQCNRMFTRPEDEVRRMPHPKAWLDDFIEYFGQLDGFTVTCSLFPPFDSEKDLPLRKMELFLKPFGYCALQLSEETIKQYLLPAVERSVSRLLEMSDADIDKESKDCTPSSNNGSADTAESTANATVPSTVVADAAPTPNKVTNSPPLEFKENPLNHLGWVCRQLLSRLPERQADIKRIELFRLRVLLRIFVNATFAGKNGALDDISGVLTACGGQFGNQPTTCHISLDRHELVEWLANKNVIGVVLKDSLHQPAYVERLLNIVRAMIKLGALGVHDLDQIWAARTGKHDAIQRNLHDMIAKLSWDFTPEQLDRLFVRFKESWREAQSSRERSLLLELIRKLAEEDREGAMADKALALLWDLAQDPSLSLDVMEQALTCHLKILEQCPPSSTTHHALGGATAAPYRTKKEIWINECVLGVLKGHFVIPAMRQLMQIFMLYPEGPPSSGHSRTDQGRPPRYRHEHVAECQQTHLLCAATSANLTTYMQRMREQLRRLDIDPLTVVDPSQLMLEGARLGHTVQVLSRLEFLSFLLREGRLWLCKEQAVELWRTLVVHPTVAWDRETGFCLFAKLQANGDVDPNDLKSFFCGHIEALDPRHLTETGMECFEHYFKAVNAKENKLLHADTPPLPAVPTDIAAASSSADIDVSQQSSAVCLPLGEQYLWRIMLSGSEAVFYKAVSLVRDVWAWADASQESMPFDIHSQIIEESFFRLRGLEETLRGAVSDEERSECLTKVSRVLRILSQYVHAYNEDYIIEGCRLPLHRSCIGRCYRVRVRVPATTSHQPLRQQHSGSTTNPQNQQQEDTIDMLVHDHQMLSSFRKDLLQRYSMHAKIPVSRGDICLNNRVLPLADDRRTLQDLFINEQSTLMLKLPGPSVGLMGSAVSGATMVLGSAPAAVVSSNENSSEEESSPSRSPFIVDSQAPSEIDARMPGCIIVDQSNNVAFLVQLCDYAMSLGLRTIVHDCWHLLRLLPGDTAKIGRVIAATKYGGNGAALETLFADPSPTTVVYLVELIHSLLLPTVITQLTLPLRSQWQTSSLSFSVVDGKTLELQTRFFLAGGLPVAQHLLKSDDNGVCPLFAVATDVQTRHLAAYFLLRVLTFQLCIAARLRAERGIEMAEGGVGQSATTTIGYQLRLEVLNQLLQNCPSVDDQIIRQAGNEAARHASAKITAHNGQLDPQLTTVDGRSVQMLLRMAWAAGSLSPHVNHLSSDAQIRTAYVTPSSPPMIVLADLHSTVAVDEQQFAAEMHPRLAFEALESLTLSVALSPAAGVELLQSPVWAMFVCDILFSQSREICSKALDTIRLLVKKLYIAHKNLLTINVDLLFDSLMERTKTKPGACQHYFHLLSCLLRFCYDVQAPINNLNDRIVAQLTWLANAKQHTIRNLEPYPDDCLLEGHLNVIRDLIEFLDPELKLQLGSAENGPCLVKQLIEEYLLPSSRMYVEQQQRSSSAAQHHQMQMQRSVTMAGDQLNKQQHAVPTMGPMTVGGGSIVGGDTVTEHAGEMTQSALPRSATTCMTPSRCVPVCSQGARSQAAAYTCLVALSAGCLENLKVVVQSLTEMFYNDPLPMMLEWEFAPSVALRGPGSFVGLKNGGATCYMNSVFQQLFMIDSFRQAILNAPGSEGEGDGSDMEQESFTSSFTANGGMLGPLFGNRGAPLSTAKESDELPSLSPADNEADARRVYNMAILRCVQILFANLLGSQLQFCVPKKFWKKFRFVGQSQVVNLREQQDALEFFNAVVDAVDEAMKALRQPSIAQNTFGGTFADQKICRGCPHRYQREEPFTSISVDIRSHNNLPDSLQEYVNGDLLEHDNAYLCEKCQRKVDAIKRLCIKKLPPILAIQLKRFDFDWEREQAVKFNDYFEFPRVLDMEPYTAAGLAKREGEVISDENQSDSGIGTSLSSVHTADEQCADVDYYRYRLRGIVVHSGQASGGHYFSYIRTDGVAGGREDENGRWYKFDDGDVTECDIDKDEELRGACFGGEYSQEMFDHLGKRYNTRRQRRWWNAYVLFYERIMKPDNGAVAADVAKASHSVVGDVADMQLCSSLSTAFENMSLSTRLRQMPPHLENMVRKKNMKFIHERNQYSVEFFTFIRTLCNENCQYFRENENLAILSIQLLSKFLFTTGLHAKKTLRGNSAEWIETMRHLFASSSNCRLWFANNVLFRQSTQQNAFSLYLLESTTMEVRNFFARLLIVFIQHSRHDSIANVTWSGSYKVLSQKAESLSDLVVVALLALPSQFPSDFGRHPLQYFNLFLNLAQSAVEDRQQLLRLDVADLFAGWIAADSSPTRHIYTENMKVFQALSLLVRSCDVSHRCFRWTALTTAGGSLVPVVTEPPELPTIVASVTDEDSMMSLPTDEEATPLDDVLPVVNDIPAAPLEYGSYNMYRYRPEEGILQKLPPGVEEKIYTEKFLKHMYEQYNVTDETKNFLQFLSWENIEFSKIVLRSLSWQLGFCYGDSKPFLLLIRPCMELGEDSWERIRIGYWFKGNGDDLSGLFDWIQINRQRNENVRKCYLLIKLMTAVLESNKHAIDLMRESKEMKKNWQNVLKWFADELNSRREQFGGGGASASSRSGGGYYGAAAVGFHHSVVHSNELNTGHASTIERTASARSLFERAKSIYEHAVKDDPEEDIEMDDSCSDSDSVSYPADHRQPPPEGPPPPYSPPPPPTVSLMAVSAGALTSSASHTGVAVQHSQSAGGGWPTADALPDDPQPTSTTTAGDEDTTTTAVVDTVPNLYPIPQAKIKK